MLESKYELLVGSYGNKVNYVGNIEELANKVHLLHGIDQPCPGNNE